MKQVNENSEKNFDSFNLDFGFGVFKTNSCFIGIETGIWGVSI